jgi:hypothetical protein
MASLARQRPPSPAVVAAATATDGGGSAQQIVAVRRRPRRPATALALVLGACWGTEELGWKRGSRI